MAKGSSKNAERQTKGTRARGGNGKFLPTAKAAERRAEALKLRLAGATYEQIAKRLDYSHRGKAHDDVMAALRAVTAEPAKELLTLELQRLDAMLIGLWRQAAQGQPAAVDRVLKIMERRAKYLGLDTVDTSASDAAKSLLDTIIEGFGNPDADLDTGSE